MIGLCRCWVIPAAYCILHQCCSTIGKSLCLRNCHSESDQWLLKQSRAIEWLQWLTYILRRTRKQASMCDIKFFEHQWHAQYNLGVVAGSFVLPWPSTEIHEPVHTNSRRDLNTLASTKCYRPWTSPCTQSVNDQPESRQVLQAELRHHAKHWPVVVHFLVALWSDPIYHPSQECELHQLCGDLAQ